MPATPPTQGGFEALLPPEMAKRAEEIGVKKAATDAVTLLVLAVLAGAFIALGGVFATVALSGAGAAPWGATRVLAGVFFSVGLILVIVGGAEPFTGNNLIVMAWAGGRISTPALLKNWCVVYAGNFLGAASVALSVWSLAPTTRAGARSAPLPSLPTICARKSPGPSASWNSCWNHEDVRRRGCGASGRLHEGTPG